MRTWLLVLLLAPWAAAESYPVLSVPAGDRVVIQYKSLPIAVPLAVIEVPAEQQAAAREALIALTTKSSRKNNLSHPSRRPCYPFHRQRGRHLSLS